MADQHAAAPVEVDRATVEAALATLGLPITDLRSVEITPRWVSATYLLREPTRALARGRAELVVEISIRG